MPALEAWGLGLESAKDAGSPACLRPCCRLLESDFLASRVRETFCAGGLGHTTSATPASTHLDIRTCLRYRSPMSSSMLHSMSPTTPGTQGLPHPFASPNTTSARGFKRSASSDDEENGDGEARPSSSSRRNTAVKRACNECRQQKVSTGQMP